MRKTFDSHTRLIPDHFSDSHRSTMIVNISINVSFAENGGKFPVTICSFLLKFSHISHKININCLLGSCNILISCIFQVNQSFASAQTVFNILFAALDYKSSILFWLVFQECFTCDITQDNMSVTVPENQMQSWFDLWLFCCFKP